jgi:hypothetical protein
VTKRKKLLKIMGLDHPEEKEKTNQKDIKEKERKEEVKLPNLHLKIPLLG